ncbi:ZIP zinc transporter [Nitzschia inconspicua]|uniref:ZIP zinc transporter n=1 Tax=Nitzschia inconspicua TaxID=303405 RepID=A0A9K3P968_9STRA|nr:ZIP zinc transporter [Nitzschia inconspicua]KAG7338258.1 ZIP zinc transporter [Nitzschia inconspicua]KAG7358196.1 ZIP zinc transporter [Nitzschia inconspicua]KAG7358211.1 ZIP zinc transporter [Nitzschia inconspicua]
MEQYDVNKLLIALAIAIVSFVSAVAPMKLIHLDAHFFSVGNLLSSGILLAAGLVHQLPDSIKKLEHSLPMKFPIAPFVSGLTFCAFMILEEYLHTQFSDRHFPSTTPQPTNDDHGEHDHTHQHRHQTSFDNENVPLLFPPPIPPPSNKTSTRQQSAPAATLYARRCSGDIESGGCPQPICRHDSLVVSHPDHAESGTLQSFRSKTFALEHQHHHHQDHVAEHMHGSLLASIILLFALSIHSILEGVAIGISTNKAEVLSTTTAVLAHKAFASYALGSSMVASQMNERHFFVLVSIFSICSVLGIFLGMGFEQVSRNSKDSSVTGIVQAMVAGTFLFVSIVEIGMKEILLCRDSKLMGDKMTRKEMEWNKLAAFLFGYLAMSSLAVII